MSYFVRIKSRVFGPFDESQLLEMKSKGKITRVTEISDNKSDWQTAESFTFLYEPEPAYVAPSVSQPSAHEPADWFYSINGTEGYGPVTAMAIGQMLRSGQLSDNSYVWQQGQNARLIKKEPRFSSPLGGSSAAPSSAVYTGDMANIGGEITGVSEQVDTGRMLRPIAASLGWLMFLKITFLLIGVVADGLFLLWWSGFSISHAIAADDATVLFITLITIVIWAALYALRFKTFLCFWQYHTILNQTVATGRASDLIQANQCQFLFWKWLGITVIANLTVIVIGITIMMTASGWVIGMFQHISVPRIPGG